MGTDFYVVGPVSGRTHSDGVFTEVELVERERARRAVALDCGLERRAEAVELLRMLGLVDDARRRV